MSKLAFEIDQEQFDGLMKQVLISDYRSLKIDNRRIYEQGKLYKLPNHVQEDYTDNLNYIHGLEAIMKFYIPHDEADRVIKEEQIKDEFHESSIDYDTAHGIDPFDEPDTNDRIMILEDKVIALEKQLLKNEYNRNVDL
jgi:hypothetical protein